LEANVDFVARALGNKGDTSRELIRNYFLNDLIYMHRSGQKLQRQVQENPEQ
jgi:hypothetical protein